jgi:hypothetical protein
VDRPSSITVSNGGLPEPRGFRTIRHTGTGGYPTIAMGAAFRPKDLVLPVVSVCLLRQDLTRVVVLRKD